MSVNSDDGGVKQLQRVLSAVDSERVGSASDVTAGLRAGLRRRARSRALAGAAVVLAVVAAAGGAGWFASDDDQRLVPAATVPPGGTGEGGDVTQGTWAAIPPNPLGVRHDAGVVWIGGEAIAYGGHAAALGAATPAPVNDGAAFMAGTDQWRVIAQSPLPPREDPLVLVADGKMVVLGGAELSGSQPSPLGAVYDPVKDSWSVIDALPAEAGTQTQIDRSTPGVGIGKRIFVWPVDGSPVIFDPDSMDWTAVAAEPAVSPADRPTDAVWTGTEVVVKGARIGVYDPATDTWRLSDSPNRAGGHGIWAGLEVLYLNDSAGHAVAFDPRTLAYRDLKPGPYHPGFRSVLARERVVEFAKGDAVAFDVLRDDWIDRDCCGSRPPGNGYYGDSDPVWTGSEILLIGSDQATSGGLRVFPLDLGEVRRAIVAIPSPGPAVTTAPNWTYAAWTGTEVVTYGYGQVAAFDPAHTTWRRLSPVPGSGPADALASLAGGRLFVVWGRGTGAATSGAVLDLSTDSWTAVELDAAVTSQTIHVSTDDGLFLWPAGDSPRMIGPTGTVRTLPDPPIGTRTNAVIVWTGTEIVIWGGLDASASPLFDGAAFNPATGQWRTLPKAPLSLRAVDGAWTGTEMIVPGGQTSDGRPMRYEGGQAFNPVTNTWREIGHPAAPQTGTGPVPADQQVLYSFRGGLLGAYDIGADEWLYVTEDLPGGDNTTVWTGDRVVTFDSDTTGGNWFRPKTLHWTKAAVTKSTDLTDDRAIAMFDIPLALARRVVRLDDPAGFLAAVNSPLADGLPPDAVAFVATMVPVYADLPGTSVVVIDPKSLEMVGQWSSKLNLEPELPDDAVDLNYR